jgi:FKBP-type peptidyl-prolyl cis-trans isomerase SlyD
MKIEKDCAVAFEFTMSDETGTVLDTSKGKYPYEYLHGYGQVVPGLEQALQGHTTGDTFTVTVSPEQAYGLRDEKHLSILPRIDFSNDELVVGNQVYILTKTGPRMTTVLKFDEEKVILDANHELAGKTLTYNIKILGVRKSTFSEQTCGHIHDSIVSEP